MYSHYRKKIKISRESVWQKYNCRCAYCGNELDLKKMQIDHLWPAFKAHQKPNEDNNSFENLMPSCAKCNNYKHALDLETFRIELERQVDMLIDRSSNFRRALQYGQISLTRKPIVFYFETAMRDGK